MVLVAWSGETSCFSFGHERWMNEVPVVHFLRFPQASTGQTTMPIARYALVALLSAVLVAVGCMPFAANDITFFGSGGASDSGMKGGGVNGAGGSDAPDIDAGTSTTTATGGGGGAGAATNSNDYGSLCGGSDAGCSPDPTAADCAPGGDPGIGGSSSGGSKLACQIVFDGTAVAAQCGVAGEAAGGDPCTKAQDCQAGLGCAATPIATGVCQQYCCGTPEACAPDTYCARGLMNEHPSQELPFCVPVTHCALLEDTCGQGQACDFVRADGTTSCVNAGSGRGGETCPCASGFTCASTTNTCLELCHIGSDDCGSGTCQGGNLSWPPDIGFCVSS